MIKGNLSMYMKSLLRFSLVTVSMSTMSLLSVNTHRSPEFTLLRLSRQKGHDCDLAPLQQQKNVSIHREMNDSAATILCMCLHAGKERTRS
jgi:hypothetical protein